MPHRIAQNTPRAFRGATSPALNSAAILSLDAACSSAAALAAASRPGMWLAYDDRAQPQL